MSCCVNMKTYSTNSVIRLFLLLVMICFSVGVWGQSYNLVGNDGDCNETAMWEDNTIPLYFDGAKYTTQNDIYIYGDLTSSYNWYIHDDVYVYGSLITGDENSITTEMLRVENPWPNRHGELHVMSGATVEVYGSMYCGNIVVEEGGTLIVHGNVGTEGGGTFSISGNLVVFGYLRGYNFDFNSTAKIVVGGEYSTNNNNNISKDAEIYIFGKNSSNPKQNAGDDGDFVNDEYGTDLYDIVVNGGLISSIEAPDNFSYSDLDMINSAANLSWSLNSDNNNVLLVYSEESIGWNPTPGKDYSNGKNVPGGINFICLSDVTTFNFTNLISDGVTYFKIWSVTNDNKFSAGVTLSIGSYEGTVFYEDFESTTDWTIGNSSNSNVWYIGSAEAFQGNQSVYVTNDNGNTAAYNKDFGGSYQSYKIRISYNNQIKIADTYKSAQLIFYWKGEGEDGYDYGSILVGDRINNLSVVQGVVLQGYNGWRKEIVDLTDYVGKSIYLGFQWTFDNNTGKDPALCIDEVTLIGTSVAPVSDFIGSATGFDSVDLTWNLNSENDSVMVAYSSNGIFGNPESGNYYSVGNYVSGGGEIVFEGKASDFSYSDTDLSGIGYYSIWSKNTGNYSASQTTSVTMPVNIPYEEDFEDGDIDGWVLGEGYENDWQIGTAANDDNSKSVYISTDKGITASYSNTFETDIDLELTVDLSDCSSAELSFDYKCYGDVYWYFGWHYDAYGTIYINDEQLVAGADMWGNDTYYYFYNKTDWTSQVVSIPTKYIGQVVTIKFKWYNNTDADVNSPGFCIDNIKLTGSIDDPRSFEATNPNNTLNNLDWDLNRTNDTIMVAWSDNETFGIPSGDKVYEVGDTISNGGTIIYKGVGDSFTHEPLNYGTIYYYKAWSTRRGIHSDGITSSANTPDKITVFSEDWEIQDKNSWTSSYSGNNSWLKYGTATNNGGTHSAYITNNNLDPKYSLYYDGTAKEATLTCEIDLSDLESCSLTFDWQCVGKYNASQFESQAYGYVTIDGNKVGREDNSNYYYDSDAWQTENIDLSGFTKTTHTLTFVWLDDLNKDWWGNSDWTVYNPGFCIDNIEVGGIYTATSTVESSDFVEPSSISSVINTSSEAIKVFDFKFVDSSNSKNDPTNTSIQQFVITKGTGNDIDDWRALQLLVLNCICRMIQKLQMVPLQVQELPLQEQILFK